MSIIKIAIALFFVTCVLASNSFIDEYNDNRADIFKLTDDCVPIIRIEMASDEYEQLKKEGSTGEMPEQQSDLLQQLLKAKQQSTAIKYDALYQQNTNGTESTTSNYNDDDNDSFKTKNASMTIELKDETLKFKKITFKLGGYSSRVFAKQGYNIKIRGDKELYGRTEFKLRPDAREATFLRSKLAYDIHNRLNLPSNSANYAQLYINDDYMGFYVFMDNIKLSWVDYEFNDEDSTHLYQCKDFKNYLTFDNSALNCTNENEEVTNYNEWFQFLIKLDDARSAKDIESFFDIDQFLYEMALEFLFGSWDHYLNAIYSHNFYMYKPPNDKWKMILYDFDGEFGQDLSMSYPYYYTRPNQFYNYSFSEWAGPQRRHLLDILIFKDPTRFNEILKDIVTRAFNPTVLFPYIDELKDFIRPYVILDKTQDENGKYPGRLNESKGDYSINQWEFNSEFTKVYSTQGYFAYGLKYWILMKYRCVCQVYEIDCDEYYLDENYTFYVDEETETLPFSLYPNLPQPVQKPLHPEEQEQQTLVASPPASPQQEQEQEQQQNQPVVVANAAAPQNEPEKEYKCWAEYIEDYHCCEKGESVEYSDEDGDWGFDKERNEWCGITPYRHINKEEPCWSENFGISCCKSCRVFSRDEDGQWGYENGQWCGIPSYCPMI